MSTALAERWKCLPGNFDRLNTRRLFPGENAWNLPALPPARPDVLPEGICAFDDWRSAKAKPASTGVHFFTDDYRFEPVWNKPDASLEKLKGAALLFTPDFSLYRDWPLAVQLWNTYRNRWMGAFWVSNGFTVVPTVGWSTPESFAFCFEGIAPGGAVAVSTMGVREPEALRLFAAGYAEMVRRLSPSIVLIHGERTLGFDVDAAPVRFYGNTWVQALRERARASRRLSDVGAIR